MTSYGGTADNTVFHCVSNSQVVPNSMLILAPVKTAVPLLEQHLNNVQACFVTTSVRIDPPRTLLTFSKYAGDTPPA